MLKMVVRNIKGFARTGGLATALILSMQGATYVRVEKIDEKLHESAKQVFNYYHDFDKRITAIEKLFPKRLLDAGK